MFSTFGTAYECDRRTDRQTDGQNGHGTYHKLIYKKTFNYRHAFTTIHLNQYYNT